MKKLLIIGVATIVSATTVSADVIGWWRFNGEGTNVPDVSATADGLPDGTVRATDGSHIYAKVYKDYEQFGNTATINGTLDVPPLNGNKLGISIGANGKIYGTFDQVRVSAGILPVDKFMRHGTPKGIVVILQ